MRLDKFLKVSRLIKRRTVAKVLVEEEVILLNGKSARPSANIKSGDKLELTLGKHHLIVLVKNISEHANKNEANTMFEIMLDEIVERKETTND